MTDKLTCAARPCASCPYRKDVPSGVWAPDEYDKLVAYDGEMIEQLVNGAIGVFMCHQRDGHLCAGWVAAHGPHDLLGLRLSHKVAPEVFDYETDIPVFSSGAEAREHGMADIEIPGKKARRLMDSLVKKGKGKL
jgi:hypothetical protein